MPRSILQFSAVALLLAASSAPAGHPANATKPAAIDFSIGGVRVGSTLDELREHLPTAVEGHAPNAIPTRNNHLVVINNGESQVPIAYFRFIKDAVSSIEVHYSAISVTQLASKSPMIDQFGRRFGDFDKHWRNDDIDGGVDIYAWESDTRFVSFALHDDGTAKLFVRSKSGDQQLYPPKTPSTTILGIDPAPAIGSGG